MCPYTAGHLVALTKGVITMSAKQLSVALLATVLTTSCAAMGGVVSGVATVAGESGVPVLDSGVTQTALGIAEAVTLDEDSVKYSASLAAAEYDTQNQVAPPSSAYSRRLREITKGLENFDGLDSRLQGLRG